MNFQLEHFASRHQFDILTIRTLSLIDAPDTQHNIMKPTDERFQAYYYSNHQRVKRKDFVCQGAFIYPAIFADGTVCACDQDYNATQPYGKLSPNTTFADIWWGQRAARIRKMIRENLDHFTFCRNCPYRDRTVHTCSVKYYDLQETSPLSHFSKNQNTP